MDNVYILLTNSETNELSLNLIEFFNSKNLSWSHYFKNSWFIVDDSNEFEPDRLRDDLTEIMGEKREFIIFKLQERFSGRIKTKSDFRNWVREKIEKMG
jgi:hypothetical protein